MTSETGTELLVHMVKTVSRVLTAGKEHDLFGNEADGWFAAFTKDGQPVLGSSTQPLSGKSIAWHRDKTEEQADWLRFQNQLTSRVWGYESTAVAITAFHFHFAYASFAEQSWNEAIVVVTAIRLGEFFEQDVLSPRWTLQSNSHIGELLKVAYWNE